MIQTPHAIGMPTKAQNSTARRLRPPLPMPNASRPAARTAAVARERLAQVGILKHVADALPRRPDPWPAQCDLSGADQGHGSPGLRAGPAIANLESTVMAEAHNERNVFGPTMHVADAPVHALGEADALQWLRERTPVETTLSGLARGWCWSRRRARYAVSPEGKARARVFVLSLKKFGEGLTADERLEYRTLNAKYPHRPDPNDPLRPMFEHLREVLRQSGVRDDDDDLESPSERK